MDSGEATSCTEDEFVHLGNNQKLKIYGKIIRDIKGFQGKK